jgi:DNA invertase Pin-like site-specific DNA recombinase
MYIWGIVKSDTKRKGGKAGMRVAYVRVSTADQNEERQIEALEKFNIEKWYNEKVSGKNTDRQQLKQMLDFVREGDEIYIMDFSRLSRSVTDLLGIVDSLNEKKVRLVSLKENLDTSTATGKMMLTVIGAIAEFERMNLLERQKEGIEIAKREGKYRGRKAQNLDNFEEVYQSWINNEITAVAAAKLLGVTRATFYKRAKTAKTASTNSLPF